MAVRIGQAVTASDRQDQLTWPAKRVGAEQPVFEGEPLKALEVFPCVCLAAPYSL